MSILILVLINFVSSLPNEIYLEIYKTNDLQENTINTSLPTTLPTISPSTLPSTLPATLLETLTSNSPTILPTILPENLLSSLPENSSKNLPKNLPGNLPKKELKNSTLNELIQINLDLPRNKAQKVISKKFFFWKKHQQRGYAAFLMLCEPDLTCITPVIKTQIVDCFNTGGSGLANQLYNLCSNRNKVQCTDQDTSRKLLGCLRSQSENNLLITSQSRACVRQVVTLGTLDCFVRNSRKKPKIRFILKYTTKAVDTSASTSTSIEEIKELSTTEPSNTGSVRKKRSLNQASIILTTETKKHGNSLSSNHLNRIYYSNKLDYFNYYQLNNSNNYFNRTKLILNPKKYLKLNSDFIKKLTNLSKLNKKKCCFNFKPDQALDDNYKFKKTLEKIANQETKKYKINLLSQKSINLYLNQTLDNNNCENNKCEILKKFKNKL